MRILLVTSEFPPDIGGIASHVCELAAALSARGTNVAVVHPRSVWKLASGCESHLYPVDRPALIKGQPMYQVMLRSWLSRRLARARADILHVHGVRPLASTRGLPARTVFTNHSSGFLARLRAGPSRRRQTARLLEHVDHVIGPSDELVEATRAFGYRGPATMIPNGVDKDRFRPGLSSQRATWGVGEHEVVVLLARRLVEKNGVTDFARALRFVKAESFRVIVAGDGPERAKMTSILSEANLTHRVHFLGAVQNAAMPDVYRAADISVLPSLAEATSIAGLEAMASGLPLVGTRVGGIPTIIDDGTSGILVNPRSPEEIARALTLLIGDRGLRRRMGDAGRKRAEEEFSWSAIARLTEDVYRACLRDAPAEASRARHARLSG